MEGLATGNFSQAQLQPLTPWALTTQGLSDSRLSPSFGNARLSSLCLQPLPTGSSVSAPLPPSDVQGLLEEAFLITQRWPQFMMLSSLLRYLFIVPEPHP